MTVFFEGVESFPLTWPIGWPRTANNKRSYSQFEDHSVAEATQFVLDELRRSMSANIIISTNVPLRRDGLPKSTGGNPSDPGVAVYFTLRKEPRVLACDRWYRVFENLWAIGKHIEAVRGQTRWGVGTIEQAFSGYAALPAPKNEWWEILGVAPNATPDQVQAAYRNLVKKSHPDAGGDQEQFIRIQMAWEYYQKRKT